MTEEEWDAVIKVHLKGTFGPSRYAAAYWRERSKAGETNDGRIINTTLAVGHLRQRRPDQLRRGQGRHRRVHDHRRQGAGPLRRHGQRHRPGRPHPHDREPRHGPGRRGDQGEDVARAGSPRSSPGWRRPSRRTSPAGCSTSPARRCRSSEGWHRGPTAEPGRRPDQARRRSSTQLVGRGPAQRQHVRLRRELRTEPCPSTPMPSAPRATRSSTRGPRRTALLYAVGVGAGAVDPLDELAFTTENTNGVPQQVLPTMAVVLGVGGAGVIGNDRHVQPGDARPRRAGHRAAPADPGRGRRSRRSARSPASATRARARSSRRRRCRPTARPASRCSPARRRRSSAARAAGAATAARRGRRTSPPERDARPRGHLRDPRRTRRCSTACRATATRCTPTRVRRDGRLRPADPPRAVHLRLHRPGAAARAVRRRPGAVPLDGGPVLVAGLPRRGAHREDVGHRRRRGRLPDHGDDGRVVLDAGKVTFTA